MRKPPLAPALWASKMPDVRGLPVALCLLPLVAFADAGVPSVTGVPDGVVPHGVVSDGGVPDEAGFEVPARTGAALLEGQPALFLQRPHAAGATLSVRGFSGVEVPVQEGPVRWTTASAGDFSPLTGVDPFWVEEAALIVGMSPVLHGTDAMGGAVQLRGPSPGFSGAGHDWSSSARAIVAGGTDAPGFRGHLRATAAGAHTAILVGASAFSEGDVNAGARIGAQPYSSLQGSAAHAVVRQRLFADSTVTLRYDYLDQAYPLTALSRARDISTARAHRHALALEGAAPRLGPFSARLSLGAHRRHSSQRRAATGPDLSTVDAIGEWATTARLELIARPRLGPLELPVRLGLDGRYDLLEADHRAGSLSGPLPLSPGLLARYPGRSSDGRGAVYLVAETDPKAGWHLRAGARGELYSQRLGTDSRLRAVEPEAPTQPSSTRSGRLLSAELGGRLALLPGWSVGARGAYSERAPSLEEQLGLGHSELGFVIPALGLVNPRGMFGELSSSFERGPVRLAAAFAFTQLAQPISWTPVTLSGALSTYDGQRLIRSTNAVRARVSSVDAELALRLPVDLRIVGHASFIEGSELRADAAEPLPLPRTPPPFGAWELRWAPPEGHLVSLALHWALPQTRLSVVDAWDGNVCAPGGQCGAEGFTALHLRGGVRLSRHLAVAAELLNLFNTTYRRYPGALAEPGFSARLALEGSL